MKPPFFVFSLYDVFDLIICQSLEEVEQSFDHKQDDAYKYKILDYDSNPFIACICKEETDSDLNSKTKNNSADIEIIKDEKSGFHESELLMRLYEYLETVEASLNCDLDWQNKSLDETIEIVRDIQSSEQSLEIILKSRK